MMADLPILMSPAMVRAILREIEQPGTGKTQTRRVLDLWCEEPPAFVENGVITALDENERPYRWPRTKAVGDRLYVREAWRAAGWLDATAPRDLPRNAALRYEADVVDIDNMPLADGRFRQGMHMPRWASRITLIVTDVRVQRVQEISEADAWAEGVEDCGEVDGGRSIPSHGRDLFRSLWDSLNASRGHGWDANPWVAAYTFTPIAGNIDAAPTEVPAL
jgi:hypothetical protein